MSKAIMLSVKPQYVAKILNGEKILEIRTICPKEWKDYLHNGGIKPKPMKCYIYCTKQGRPLVYGQENACVSEHYTQTFGWSKEDADEIWGNLQGKILAEFTLNEIDRYSAEFVDNDCYEDIRLYTENPYAEDIGNMYWEDIIITNNEENPSDCNLCKQSCLTYEEIKKYVGVNFHSKPFYAWHIDDLKIYDEPKELSKFKHWKKDTHCHGWYCNDRSIENSYTLTRLTRPFQSWGYVEILGEESDK